MDCTVIAACQTWLRVWASFAYYYPTFNCLCDQLALNFSCLTSDSIASCFASVAFTVFGRDTIFELAAVTFHDCHGRLKLVRSSQGSPAKSVRISSSLETSGEASSVNWRASPVCYGLPAGSWLKVCRVHYYCFPGFHCSSCWLALRWNHLVLQRSCAADTYSFHCKEWFWLAQLIGNASWCDPMA